MKNILLTLSILLFGGLGEANSHLNFCKTSSVSDFSITTSSTQILAKNINRRCLMVVNKGSTNIYIKFDSVHSSTEGIMLVPTGSWEPDNVPTNSIFMESASGTDAVSVIEGTQL